MRLLQVLLVGWGLTFALDASTAEPPASEKPPASKPAPAAKRKHRRTSAEDARQACLEKCRQRNMHIDCADAEGNMVSCPCHCD